jgi:hypothetical protein
MNKRLPQLTIAIISVVIVAALTSGAAFAFGNGKISQLIPLLVPSTVQQQSGMQAFASTINVEKTGLITELTADSVSVDGTLYKIDALTDLDAGLAIGTLVEVHAIQLADGTLLARDVCFALESAGKPSSTEVPQDGAVEMTGLITELTADSLSVDGTKFLIDASTDLDHGLAVGSLVEAEALKLADGTLLAKDVCFAEGKDNKSTEINQDGSEFEMYGVVSAVGEVWIIDGVEITTTLSTDIDSEIVIGDLVSVEGHIVNGIYVAEEICLEKDDSNQIEDKNDDLAENENEETQERQGNTNENSHGGNGVGNSETHNDRDD